MMSSLNDEDLFKKRPKEKRDELKDIKDDEKNIIEPFLIKIPDDKDT